jgi:ATP-dependent RNA helicase RhlE
VSFDQLGLSPELLRAVADQGYTEPTPVQAGAIPLILQGRDVLGGAQTGTGKTAAFVLPILQRLHTTEPPRIAGSTFGMAAPAGGYDAISERPTPTGSTMAGRRAPRRSARVLVLVPTRELALQVEESVRVYGAHRPVRSVPIYGGVGYDAQFRALKNGAEIVVATPGRLLDHIAQGTVDLTAVEVLVLDEADRMLDMGFIRDIRKILAILPAARQNLLFSATFSDEIRKLASAFMHDPATVQATPRNTATELVRQVVIKVDRERKRDLLRELVASGRVDQALVFTRTKHGANRLAEQLVKDGISAAAIHGNRSQNQRVRALADFKAGKVAILVATEVAARGIDIEELPHVVNYELPMVPEDYLHRIGRTGRAGATGDAISLVCVDEGKLLRDIEMLLGSRIEVETIAGYEPDRNIRPEPIRLRSIGEPEPSRGGFGARRPSFGGHAPRPASAGARSPQPHRSAHQGRPGAAPARGGGAPARPAGGPSRPGYGQPRPVSNPARPGIGQPRPSIGNFTALPGERIARHAGGQPGGGNSGGHSGGERRPGGNGRPSAPRGGFR